MDANRDNATSTAESKLLHRSPEVRGQTMIASSSTTRQMTNKQSERSNMRVMNDNSDSDENPDSEADSDAESELLTAPAKTNVRWTAPEMVKLAEILNARRDLEASDSSLVKMTQPELFVHGAEQMLQFFPAQRTGPACFSHWYRYGGKVNDRFVFNSKESTQAKKGGRSSTGGAASTPKQRRRVSGFEQEEDNEASDDNEQKEDASSTPAKVRKSKSKTDLKSAKSEGAAQKRTVVRFTPEEMEILKEDALTNAYPDMPHKQQLADDLGIDVKRIIRFFSNVQAGNYSWARHLKNTSAPAAAGDFEDEDSIGIINSPNTAAAETPGRQTPDSVDGIGKGKRRHTPTAKALEAEMSKKKRNPRGSTSMRDDSRNGDEPMTPSQTRNQSLSASKATAAKSIMEEGSLMANSVSRLKQSHRPSPLAAQAALSDEMEIDSADEQAGLSKSAALTDESKKSNVLVPLHSQAPDGATDPMSKLPIMVKRIAAPLPDDKFPIPFDPEHQKAHAANVSREVRAEMTEDQLYRANNPPASPYDMGPIPKNGAPAPASESTPAKLENTTKTWEDERAKLEGEIYDDIQFRRKLIKGTLLLKNRYNTGNKKLQDLSAEYNNPECTHERKVALTKDFNETQAWMTADRDSYNRRRVQSEEIKKSIAAKSLKVNQLKYFLLRNSQKKIGVVTKINLENKQTKLAMLKEASQAEISATYAEIALNGPAAWVAKF